MVAERGFEQRSGFRGDVFGSGTEDWKDFYLNFKAFIFNDDRTNKFMKLLQEAEEKTRPITNPTMTDDEKEASAVIYWKLVQVLKHPVKKVALMHDAEENGLEVWRLLVEKYGGKGSSTILGN